jgi:hypothetical protein
MNEDFNQRRRIRQSRATQAYDERINLQLLGHHNNDRIMSHYFSGTKTSLIALTLLASLSSWLFLDYKRALSSFSNFDYQLSQVRESTAVHNINNNVQEREILETMSELSKIPSCSGKEKFLKFILMAKNTTNNYNPQDLCESLPTLQEVANQYGSEPVIYGLDTCQTYRNLLKAEANNGSTLPPMPRVAGLYNTGTNALTRLLEMNFPPAPVLDTKISPYQVPWGKHVPPIHRWTNRCPLNNNESKKHVLPIVVVRDPFFWMQSMVRRCLASFVL